MLFCRLYEEMKGFLDLDLEIPTSDRALVRDLSKWLKACSKRQRCIIVLDALNQMDEGSKEDGQIQLQSQQSVSNLDKSWPENNYVQQFLLFCQSKCLTTFAKIFWNFYWKIKEIFCHTFLLSSRYWKESQKKVWQPLIWFGKLLNNLVFIWLQPCNKVFIWLCHGIIIVHEGGGGQCACIFWITRIHK